MMGSIVVLFARCKELYDPHIESKTTGLLIVEGFLNSGQGPTTIHLSQSTGLEDPALKPEFNALVNVQGEDGSNFPLLENGGGAYSIPQLTLSSGVKYRLHIRTVSGKEYASDYTPVKYTPPIDSITWQSENDGLRIYANARDPQNDTKYYQWQYEETWEIHTAFYTSLKYVQDSATGAIGLAWRMPDHSPDTMLHKCWNTITSTTIILGSTEKLSSDVVYLPVQYIDPHSEKLSVLYSINLRQYAISQENYLFLQKMKKNTEQLGTMFDPQPSEISGNIHCLNNPNERAIGYVEITQEQIKRAFIYNSQVPGWNYDPNCFQIEVDVGSISKYYDLYPTTPLQTGAFGSVKTFFATNDKNCMDCTVRGVNQKPSFWP